MKKSVMSFKKLLFSLCWVVCWANLLWAQQNPANKTVQDFARMELSPQTSKLSPKQDYLEPGGTFSITVKNVSPQNLKELDFQASVGVSNNILPVRPDDKGSPKNNCDDDSIVVKPGDTCQFKLKVKSDADLKEVQRGHIRITAPHYKAQTFYINLSHPTISISSNSFTHPSSEDVPKTRANNPVADSPSSIVVTNSTPEGGDDSDARGVCFDDATIPSGQTSGAGVTLPDSAFVGSGSKCLKKYACSGDKMLDAGKSCEVDVNIANDAYGSTNIKLKGDFGEKIARVNIANTHLNFFKEDDQTDLANDHERVTDEARPFAVHNSGEFTLRNLKISSEKGNVNIDKTPDRNNNNPNCGDISELESGESCDLKVDFSNRSKAQFDYVNISGDNLPNGTQRVFIFNDQRNYMFPVTNSYIRTPGKKKLRELGKQLGPNMIVFKFVTSNPTEINSFKKVDDFIKSVSGELSKDDFVLYPKSGCLRRNQSPGSTWSSTSEGASATGCERILFYTKVDPPAGKPKRMQVTVHENNVANEITFNVDTNLVVGGHFISAGNKANTTNIARWSEDDNGDFHWHSLGLADQSETINAIKMANGSSVVHTDSGGGILLLPEFQDLYVAGQFNNMGDNNRLNNIAFWKGCLQCWQKLVPSSGSNFSWSDGSSVESLTRDGPIPSNGDVNLFLGGDFKIKSNNSGVVANHVAKWVFDQDASDGNKKSWEGLTDSNTTIEGTNGPVLTLQDRPGSNNGIGAAGEFDEAGGHGSTKIAIWDGFNSQWKEWGTNSNNFESVGNASDPVFRSGHKLGSDWFMGGEFKLNDDNLFVAYKPDNEDLWQEVSGLKTDFNQTLHKSGIYTLTSQQVNNKNLLYLGGFFEYAISCGDGHNLAVCDWNSNDAECDSLIEWSGWPNDRVNTLFKLSNTGLFIGGDFTKIGSTEVAHLAEKQNPDSDGSLKALLDDDTGKGISSQGTVNVITTFNMLVPEKPVG